MDVPSRNNLMEALRNSKKGQLRYDRYWEEEGRTKDILEEISNGLSTMKISPAALAAIQKHDHPYSILGKVNDTVPEVKKPVLSPPKPIRSDDDMRYIQMSTEKELAIIEYEEEMSKSAQEIYNKKREEYDCFAQELLSTIEEQYQISKQNRQAEAVRKSFELEKFEQSLKDSLVQNSEEIPDFSESQINGAILNNEMTIKDNYQIELQEYQYLVSMSVSKVEELIKICDHKHLSITCQEWIRDLIAQVTSLSKIIKKSEETPISDVTMNKVHTIVQDTELLCRSITAEVEKAIRKSLIEMKEKEKESKNIPKKQKININISSSADEKQTDTCNTADEFKIEQKLPQLPSAKSSAVVSLVPVPEALVEVVPVAVVEESKDLDEVEKNIESEVLEILDADEMEECEPYNVLEDKQQVARHIDLGAFSEYCSVMENLKKVEASLEPFKSNPQHKKYRLELHKAVAINTISDASGAQLKTKIYQLTSLLSGQTVESGGKFVSCKTSPLALTYCKNLLAEKIVTQGEDQVGAKISAAFPFAMVVVALTSKFPDLWQLILGHFYSKCPYLVPYYPPREENESDNEYYISLGYKHVDGKIEETTNFLKRMGGYAALYAAILQTEAPVGFPPKKSHNVKHGWQWLARMLNMDPRPDITATLLLSFLEVLGYSLSRAYDKQFKKILHILCKDYFQKIREVPATGGPVGRLRDFLHFTITKKRVSPPAGVLSNHIWRN